MDSKHDKSKKDMLLQEKVEFLEYTLTKLTLKNAELSTKVNLLIKVLGIFDNNPKMLAIIEKENEFNKKLLEDFEISKFRNDIKDL